MNPDSTMRMLRIGRITFSRFCFGTPTRADDFDPTSGNIIVVNTLRGSVRHPLGGNAAVDTGPGTAMSSIAAGPIIGTSPTATISSST